MNLKCQLQNQDAKSRCKIKQCSIEYNGVRRQVMHTVIRSTLRSAAKRRCQSEIQIPQNDQMTRSHHWMSQLPCIRTRYCHSYAYAYSAVNSMHTYEAGINWPNSSRQNRSTCRINSSKCFRRELLRIDTGFVVGCKHPSIRKKIKKKEKVVHVDKRRR